MARDPLPKKNMQHHRGSPGAGAGTKFLDLELSSAPAFSGAGTEILLQNFSAPQTCLMMFSYPRILLVKLVANARMQESIQRPCHLPKAKRTKIIAEKGMKKYKWLRGIPPRPLLEPWRANAYCSYPVQPILPDAEKGFRSYRYPSHE